MLYYDQPSNKDRLYDKTATNIFYVLHITYRLGWQLVNTIVFTLAERKTYERDCGNCAGGDHPPGAQYTLEPFGSCSEKIIISLHAQQLGRLQSRFARQ